LTRSRLVGSSCDSPGCVIKMLPADICFPTLCSTSTRIRPLPVSSSGLAPCVRQLGCALLDRGIERFHDARIASWIAGLAGEFSSQFRDIPSKVFRRWTLRPTLTSLSLPSLRAHPAISRRAARGEGCQDRFHIARRDACAAFPTRDAFPRQVILDSACPLQVTDREPELDS